MIVLYIGGWGRSGSTLLGRLLQAVPGATFLGEASYLWSRGVHQDRLCGCGERFSACPFWSAVGRRMDGWADVDRMRSLGQQVVGHRHLPRLLLPRAGRSSAAIDALGARHAEALAAAADVAGTQVIIDSSKMAPHAMMLARAGVDLRVINLVRDARAVAYSWSRSKASPDAGAGAMKRHGPVRSSGYWMLEGILLDVLRTRGVPTALMRYEDLVRDATGVLRAALRSLDVPLSVPDAPRTGATPAHTVSGNPDRFDRGPIVVREDARWKDDMPSTQRALVTALTWPMLLRYGYVGRRSG